MEVLPPEPRPEEKARITIRLDQDSVDRFFRMAEEAEARPGTKPYGSISTGKAPKLEETLRGIIREDQNSIFE